MPSIFFQYVLPSRFSSDLNTGPKADVITKTISMISNIFLIFS